VFALDLVKEYSKPFASFKILNPLYMIILSTCHFYIFIKKENLISYHFLFAWKVTLWC